MNSIEIIIGLILLLMAVPDLCRKFNRPALANAMFVVFGLVISPVLTTEATELLIQAGAVGFLLVLLEVGLEIDLPKLREMLGPMRFAAGWVLIQFPVIVMLATVAGLELPAAMLAAAALTGCSLSMSYQGWKQYPGLAGAARDHVLHIMVTLELIAVVVLSVGAVGVEKGFGWTMLVKLAGIAVVIIIISRFSTRLVNVFQRVIEESTHWRVHILVLLVLVVCAVGERLGLAAAKTAFFLGLFMSHARYRGVHIEEHIAPISRRFLIPIFFVSLGLKVDERLLFSYTALLALLGAFLLIGLRDMMHRRLLATGGDRNTFLLFCPNLTMAALAATALLNAGQVPAATWTIFSGLFLSVAAIALLPPVKQIEATPQAATKA